MKDQSKLEKIFKDQLYSEEITAPEGLFDRISAARRRQKRRVLWLRFTGMLFLAGIVAGGILMYMESEVAENSPSKDSIKSGSAISSPLKDDIALQNTGKDHQITQTSDVAGTDLSSDALHENFTRKVAEQNIQSKSQESQDRSHQTDLDKDAEKSLVNDEKILTEKLTESKNEDLAVNQPVNSSELMPENKIQVPSEEVKMNEFNAPSETELSEENKPEPESLIPGKWNILISGGAGSMIPFYSGSESGSQAMKEAGSSGLSPTAQWLVQYRIQPNWKLETGVTLTRGNLIQEMDKTMEVWRMTVAEQRVKIYDPVLPPYEMVIRDTGYQLEQRTVNETARYQRSMISIPVGIAHTWWSKQWEVSTALGIQFHVLQNYTGSLIDPSEGSQPVMKLLLEQSRTSAYASLRVSRRINDRWSVLAAPSLSGDIRSSQWKNNIHRRDMWWHVQTGLSYQF